MKDRFFERADVGVGLIVLSTVIAYVPAYRGGFIWDDDHYVSKNPTLQSVDGLRRIWAETDSTPQYYPVTFTSFWIENQIWGLSPAGYHVVNVLLHAVGAVLLWRVLLLLRVHGALVAAMVFALHPMHVESVAWISERKNVLSGFFYLAAMLAYFRWEIVDETEAAKRGHRKYYILAIVLFLCALLSKSVTVTLPVAILLILWWKRGCLTLRGISATIPFFAAALSMALITIAIERHHVGTEHLDWNLGSIDRLLIAGRAACFYLWKLVWPAPLIFIYPRWDIDRSQMVQYLYPIAVLIAVILLFVLRRRIGRGPVAAAFFYLVTLAPALGIILAYPMRFSFVADHFCYLASIGPIALGSAVFARYCRRTSVSTGIAAAGIVTGAFGVLTWQQTRIYRDLETLWRDTLAKNPGAWIAENNLGRVLVERNRFDEAIEHLSTAARLYPEYPEARNNLGIALLGAGRLDEAVVSLQEALRIVPDYLNARFSLGRVRERQGRADDAIAEYREALKINPFFIQAYVSLAPLLARQGKVEEGLATFDRGIEVFGAKPGAAQLLRMKATMLLALRRPDEAIEACRKAAGFVPNDADAHLALANTLFQTGKIDEAAAAYERCLSLNPNLAQGHFNLGVIRVSQGKPDEGQAHFDAAVRIKPDYAEAHFNRGQLMEAAGQFNQAAETYREVLRLAPHHADAKARLESLARRSMGISPTSGPSM